jgi:hypothetical protein
MLKPYSPALMANSVGIDSDNQPRIIDFFPDIIFVHNKSKVIFKMAGFIIIITKKKYTFS